MANDGLPRQVPGPCAMPAVGGRDHGAWDPHGVAEWRVREDARPSRWWRFWERRRPSEKA